MRKIYILILSLLFNYSTAQVGIGIKNPQAELHINTTTNGIPALRLEPQSNPVGSSTGQISVIEDKLYMYDATRGKWLSVEATKYSFDLEDGADNQSIEYIGDIENSGPVIPFNGTIVYMAMNASGGQVNKGVQMLINGNNVADNADARIDGLMNLDNYKLTKLDYNLNVNQNDMIQFEVVAAGNAVNDLSVDLWIKWRK